MGNKKCVGQEGKIGPKTNNMTSLFFINDFKLVSIIKMLMIL